LAATEEPTFDATGKQVRVEDQSFQVCPETPPFFVFKL
jgi:hypothetical protein